MAPIRFLTLIPLSLFSLFIEADDIFDLSLQELQSIKVEVASIFEVDTLDVASSTAVLTPQDWRKHASGSLGMNLESVPSVLAGSTWGGSEVLAIRGYATELSVRGISYTLDSIPLGTYVYANSGYALSRVPLGLMSKVEMIRGPGSAIYGSDAFHGVLAFDLAESITNHTDTRLELGSHEKQQLTLRNSTHQDAWKVHSGFSFESEGPTGNRYAYTDPESGSTQFGERKTALESISAFTKIKTGELNRSGIVSGMLFFNQFEGRDYQGIGRQFFIPFEQRFDLESLSLSTDTDKTDGDSQFALAALQHNIQLTNEMELENKVYAWQSEHVWTFDNRGYPDSLTLLPSISGGATLLCKPNEASASNNPLYCPHVRTQSADEQRIGYQIQLKQQYNPLNTQWVIAAGYDEIKVHEARFERRDLNDNLMIGYDNDYKGDSRQLTHILTQARTGFLDNSWLLSYGLRWDNYSDASDHLSPRIGLVHKINEQWRQKWLYGHAYRAPTALEIKGSSTSVIGNENLNAETIDTFEYVLMYQSNTFSMEGVLFTSQWNDAISLKPVSGLSSTNQYQNVNENEARGLELTLNKTLHHWRFTAVSSFVESKNVSDNEDYQAFPKFMLSLNAEYRSKSRGLLLGSWYRHMQDYALGDDRELFSERNEQYNRFDLYADWSVSTESTVSLQIFNVLDAKLALPSYYGSEGGHEDPRQEFVVSFSHAF